MRKLDVLNILGRHDDLDASSVAQWIGCTRAAAGMLLLRLTRQGLIGRALDSDDRVLFYSLTEKGRVRLAYLTKIIEKKR